MHYVRFALTLAPAIICSNERLSNPLLRPISIEALKAVALSASS